MAELSKIRKNGVEYDIKDAAARKAIEDLELGGTVTDEQIASAVEYYMAEHPVTGGDCLSSNAKNLLITILRNGVYNADQSDNITALATELGMTEDETHTHSYTSAVTKAATCETAGVRTYTCSCGHSYTQSIPATGHNYVDGVCTVCGATDPTYNPEVTLTSISATYSGGDVAVGTVVNDLTGIVVTAHYSDGTSEAVANYTLSGTIGEGSNTITVSYGGKTATFTVTGIDEAKNIDIPEDNLLGYYDMRTALTADNYITDLSGNGRDILFYPDNGYYENGYMYRGDKASNWINESPDYSITDGASEKYSYGENVTLFVTISGCTGGTTPLVNTGSNNTAHKQLITFQGGVILYHQHAGFNNVAGSTALTKEGVTTICAVITASEEKIYLDGVLKSTIAAKGGSIGKCLHLLMGYSNTSDANTRIHNAAV